METMFWVWLGVIVGALILEFITMDLVSCWFSVGAVIPFILSATGKVDWKIQVTIFIILSAILIVALRGVTRKWLKKGDLKTNSDSIIGQKFTLLENCGFETMGTLKINGVIWSVLEENRKEIKAGKLVKVVKIEGNKLIVKEEEI